MLAGFAFQARSFNKGSGSGDRCTRRGTTDRGSTRSWGSASSRPPQEPRSIGAWPTCLWDSNTLEISNVLRMFELHNCFGSRAAASCRRIQVQNSVNIVETEHLQPLEGTGGESGIRTLTLSLDSVSYRFHNAMIAVDASDAVAHCTPLHAGSAVRQRILRDQARVVQLDRAPVF